MNLWKQLLLLPCFSLAALMTGCGGPQAVPGAEGDAASSQTPGTSLTGGGSTFVNFAMGKWTNMYNKQTGTKVNYQAIGSGGGIQQFAKSVIDFGASDAPMTDDQIKEVGSVLHIPVTMGAVVVTYNLPGLAKPLTLSGPVLGDIFLGKVKKWNDPAIAALNEGVALPDADIVVARRADGSGTTFIFADYLSKTNPEWQQKVGTGTSLNWPTGMAGKGNEGVAAQVKQIPNSIGYVELLYALGTNMPTANIINAEGNAITPSVDSVTAAAANLQDVPDDLRMSITNPPGADAYPISGMVWVLARPTTEKPEKNQELRRFLEFVLTDEAQEAAVEKYYSKLPPLLLEKAKAKVAQIQ